MIPTLPSPTRPACRPLRVPVGAVRAGVVGVVLAMSGCAPAGEVCSNGVDDDDDGRIDCADEGCVFDPLCGSCGDGHVDLGESCDDGNRQAGDGCDDRCILERCGDGVLDDEEECDDGNVRAGDGCDARCLRGSCGDAVLQADEECEDGNRADGDGCDHACRAEIEDCLAVAGVECFDGNQRSGDGCSATCRGEFCGDGIVQPTLGERCDDTNVDAAVVGCRGCQITVP